MVSEIFTRSGSRLSWPTIGSATLSAVVAVYIVAVLNWTFWSKAATYFDTTSLLLLATGLTALVVALCTALSVKYLTKPIFVLLVVGGAMFAWFMDNFGTIIDLDMIRNAAETTKSEAGHLITPAFLFHMLVTGLLPAVLIILVRIDHRPFVKKVIWNLAVILPCLAIFAIAGLSHARTFASTSRAHRDLVATLNPFTPLFNVFRFALATKGEAVIVVQSLGTDARVASHLAKPRITIVVAGETARAENFALNGYDRDTNPELSKQDIIYFPKTSSCGTATAVSIPCMFSVYTRSSYTHEKGLATENLMDVLTHAGIKTEWWENNTGDKGVAKRISKISISDINDPRFCKDHECLDEAFLDRLGPFLNSVTTDTVLVLHQLGSHGPAYYQRVPEAYRHFRPECLTAEIGKCSNEQIVNSYDNSIRYTDHILGSIIDMLKAREAKIAPSMIYMSDHGESLGEHGLYLHGAPYFIAPSQQTHVPFVLWLGKDASQILTAGCLTARTAKPASHDNLFHTVLGIMNVKTSAYDPALDIYGACRTEVAS